MATSPTPRVQLVISSKFIFLLLLAAGLLGGGYYWYNSQQESQERLLQTQERFKTPPYFVNGGASVIRSCQHCLEAGKLRPQASWKIFGPQEIPATEQRWFLAVEDPPMPVTVAGVLMLPVHPALRDNPSFGFDQTHVELVLYQSLVRKPRIESGPPPPPIVIPPPPEPEPPKPSPTEPSDTEAKASRTAEDDAFFKLKSPFVGDWRNVDLNTKSLTRLLITGDSQLVVHAWARCQPADCDWGLSSGVPLPPADGSFLIVWDHKYALHRQELSLQSDGKLKVSLQTHFTDNSGRRDLEIISFFTRFAGAP